MRGAILHPDASSRAIASVNAGLLAALAILGVLTSCWAFAREGDEHELADPAPPMSHSDP